METKDFVRMLKNKNNLDEKLNVINQVCKKEIIVDDIEVRDWRSALRNKEREYEELRQYHNKCCEENANELKDWLEKYSRLSQDFYSGKYCNAKYCKQLQAKKQECERLNKQIQSQKEEIKNLNYILYEDYELTTDLVKANLKISRLERDLSSVRNRFKYENQVRKEQFKIKEQECEEYKKKFSRFFNIDNQECWDIAFLNNEKAKYKQALDEIEKICQIKEENSQFVLPSIWQQILDIINNAKDNKQ